MKWHRQKQALYWHASRSQCWRHSWSPDRLWLAITVTGRRDLPLPPVR